MATRKNAIVFAIILAVCGMALTVSTQAKQDSASNKIVGTWVGQPNKELQVKLPPGEITVKSDGGKLSGAWTVYAQISEDGGLAEIQKRELPLIDPKFERQTLSFKADMQLRGIVEIEFKLVDDDQAELRFVGKDVPENVKARAYKYKRAHK